MLGVIDPEVIRVQIGFNCYRHRAGRGIVILFGFAPFRTPTPRGKRRDTILLQVPLSDSLQDLAANGHIHLRGGC